MMVARIRVVPRLTRDTRRSTWHLPEGGFTYYRGRVTSLGLVR